MRVNAKLERLRSLYYLTLEPSVSRVFRSMTVARVSSKSIIAVFEPGCRLGGEPKPLNIIILIEKFSKFYLLFVHIHYKIQDMQ